MIPENNIYHGDCLEYMPSIKEKSIDLIVTDLPFGQTHNKWDKIISYDKLWENYKRIIKQNGAIILFGQGMFSAELMLSNKKMWKYNLIWKKGERTSGFLNAKKMPLRNHEDILVFYEKPPIYNPQFIIGKPSHSRGTKGKLINNNYNKYNFKEGDTENGELKYPKSILDFDRPHPPIHPTEKPIKLIEWLIKSFSNENEIVLDSCMGVGTTILAAINTNRKYIGIEQNEEYFKIAEKRIAEIKL
jgi:site-specific DNA-methyltransferase (adenine-specific)